MSNDFDFTPPEDSDDAPKHEGNDDGENNPDVQSQEIQHSQIGALVPENVARGVFSTGAVVLNGNHEFVVDFLLRMTRPHQVAARNSTACHPEDDSGADREYRKLQKAIWRAEAARRRSAKA
jgi:hypothetical protein